MSTNLSEILVPVDGSEGSLRAVRFAAGLAADTDAEIILIHVYDATSLSIMGLTALTRKELEAMMKRVAHAYFSKAKASIESPVRVREIVRLGHPANEIVNFAEEEKPDLIVMGCRGQGEFQRLFVGSVSEQVVHHAPCPVTVVR